MNQLTITTMTTTMHDITDNYTTLPLFSLNVNGMSEEKKRKKLFEILINKNTDITPIQETHSTKNLTSKLEKEWLDKSFWNSGTVPRSSGVEKI